ncbi:autotransporter outer membrane beta-barrel domain-containing protein [Pseudomonas sp. UFMG81]|uniref:autotransporter family protein n=1 Tax=Pseudomonas sp. UFMG81 TaxID=2745936 RepID=UPI00188E0FEA|nr:autotransporter outer membrane beta-barrel domain-containing protein [Pseudomonas sp. UFMG81]
MSKALYRLVWNTRPGAAKHAAWPLALLSLGVASGLSATPLYTVTTGADSGPGSLRDALQHMSTVSIAPSVSSIALNNASPIDLNATTRLQASAPVNISGASLRGDSKMLTLDGAIGATLTGIYIGARSGTVSPYNGSNGANGIDGTFGMPGTLGTAGGSGSNGGLGALVGQPDGQSAITGNGFSVTNMATVWGGQGITTAVSGAGGRGGNAGASGSTPIPLSGGNGGAGGAGGYGANGGSGFFADNISLTNYAMIIGGNGSNGVQGGAGGAGGNSGVGSIASSNGGNGGRGGDGGSGGTGGHGVFGQNLQVVNHSLIQGGNGGTGGAGGIGGQGGTGNLGPINAGTKGADGASGQFGWGGVGVIGLGNSTVYNYGTISGGYANGGSGEQQDAIELLLGNNRLVLGPFSVINGKVTTDGTGSDVLILGGSWDERDGPDTFDLGNLGDVGSDKQYQGFGAFEKEGSSVWTLTGTDSWGKAWSVKAGTLQLADGASLLGSVNIAQGATLNAGAARIGGSLNNSGLLSVGSAGSPYATLTVGDFTQQASGVLRVGALSASQYGALQVNGNAQLDGTLDIDVKAGNTLAGNNRLGNVVSTTGTVSGRFSQVTDNSLLFDFTPTYTGNSVDLNVVGGHNSAGGSSPGHNTVRGSVQALGNTPAVGAAAVLDGVIASAPASGLASRFIPLSTQAEVSQAASEALPLMAGGSTVAAKTALTSVNRLIEVRGDTLRGAASGDLALTEQHLWIKPFGSWADLESSGGADGARTNVGGLAIGADAAFSDSWTLGSAFVYANADTRTRGGSTRQSLDTDVYQLVGYGIYHIDDVTDLRLQVDGGKNRNEGTRDIDFAGLRAKSRYDSWTAHAGVALDRTYSLTQATRITPSVRADYTWIKDEDYRETGAQELNLNAKSRSTDQFILGLDGKLEHDLSERLKVSALLGAGYDFLAERDAITTAFAGAPGAAFTTVSGEPQRWLARGATALSYQANEQLQLSARYDVEKRTHFLNQTASVEARWAF